MTDPKRLFEGKRITVMGLGLLGRGLGDTLFLIRCGARVTVTDLKSADELASSLKHLDGLPCKLKLGGHDPEDFSDTDMVLRNADVPRSSRFLEIAARNGVPVEMDESLFCKHFRGTVVGVTGTRGKTTTATLSHAILKAQQRRTFLAGNVMGKATLPLLETAGDDDTVVLELSSWQLQGFHDAEMSPHFSVFTNIYPDHLNRYRDMDEYIYDKKAIYLYQRSQDLCVFNADHPGSRALAAEAPGRVAFFSKSDIPAGRPLKLPGNHNRENVAAARAVCLSMGLSDDVIRKTAEDFSGVEHRLQRLGEKDGVEFVNDSTSTTPVAGCAALEAFPGRGILLIAGGADKKLDLTPFAAAAVARCKRIALLEGSATPELHGQMLAEGGEKKITGVFGSLGEAVESLTVEAVAGDLVLLSPGCASFGLFKNEFHRGETFMEIVRDSFGLPEQVPAAIVRGA